MEEPATPAVVVPPEPSLEPAPPPAQVIDGNQLRMLAAKLASTFKRYAAERRPMEQKWLRNLRQYRGIYDPEIAKKIPSNRSQAYPRITRVKCISVLSRLMNLMFPGNERNWALKASPHAELAPQDVMRAVEKLQQEAEAAGVEMELTPELMEQAVQNLADEEAHKFELMIDDQLQELGGDQTHDYVRLNRKVLNSGIMYGTGLLRGPFVRSTETIRWRVNPQTFAVEPIPVTTYKPQFEFLSVWDYYPDMSAKTIHDGDGHFIRVVMSRQQLRQLAQRGDFFADNIKQYLRNHENGNYTPQSYESELRQLGARSNVNLQSTDSSKYEVLIWEGSLSGRELSRCGVEVAEDQMADDIEAEVWMVGDTVIKAAMNPWRQLGIQMQTVHPFIFDQDDSTPLGYGLPDVMRDSQMTICQATRMLLDNASIVCGPIVEVNLDLMQPEQDLASIEAYRVFYRQGVGADANYPAVRNLNINGHLESLMQVIETFMHFADTETFVGPATGGDMAQAPSEPMRTAAGASMIRADAALPFKDIVRNFDAFTQSVIYSLVMFNQKFNPAAVPGGDIDVIARGATSLIAKEVRGIQVDQMAATMTPEEREHVDERKLVEARFAVRDLSDLLVPKDEALRRKTAREQQQAEAAQQQEAMMKAEMRKVLADAFKSITQGQKNTASADATAVKAAIDILESGADAGAQAQGAGRAQADTDDRGPGGAGPLPATPQGQT